MKQKNIQIGEEIVVASFDNIETIANLSPSLTSVQINAKSIGQAAVRMALERIDGIRDEPIILTYPARLIVRDSFIPRTKDIEKEVVKKPLSFFILKTKRQDHSLLLILIHKIQCLLVTILRFF